MVLRADRRTGAGRWSRGLPLRKWAIHAAVFAVRCYQWMIRPHLVGSCKFCPTCSEYAIEALTSHGLFRGTGLSIRRLIRCRPFRPGGLDPVP